MDGCCGAGGDSIQISKRCKRVLANDIDPIKISLLKNNARVYGIDNITSFNQDFLSLNISRNIIDAVYLSPPWGGPNYNQVQ